MGLIDSADPMSNRYFDIIMPESEPIGDIRDPDSLDPISLGFMCGIEIHQQLSSGKLHSRQPGVLYDGTEDQIQNPPPAIAKRRLRAARGESGTVDVAARFEEMRNRSFAYLQTPNSGLIELDEAPLSRLTQTPWTQLCRFQPCSAPRL